MLKKPWFSLLSVISAFVLGILLWWTNGRLTEAQEDFNDWEKTAKAAALGTAHDHEAALIAHELQAISHQVNYLAKSKTVNEALTDLVWGFQNLKPTQAAAFGSDALRTHYNGTIFKDRPELMGTWFPTDPVAIYLQSFYGAGQRSWDKSHPYHFIPDFYGPDLRAQLDLMQAASLLLIGPEGQVLYGENAGLLLGNNLLKAPYGQTPAGQLLEEVVMHQGFRVRQITDPISQSLKTVAGAPIRVDDKTVGFLMAELKNSVLPAQRSFPLISHQISWAEQPTAKGDTLVSPFDWNGHAYWLSTWNTP